MRNKEDFLKILKKHYPLVGDACIEFGIARKTYHEWYKEFPDFRDEVDSLRESLLDISENVLFNAVKSGDVKAAQFALTKLAKLRGYNDSIDLNVSGEVIFKTKWGGDSLKNNNN